MKVFISQKMLNNTNEEFLMNSWYRNLSTKLNEAIISEEQGVVDDYINRDPHGFVKQLIDRGITGGTLNDLIYSVANDGIDMDNKEEFLHSANYILTNWHEPNLHEAEETNNPEYRFDYDRLSGTGIIVRLSDDTTSLRYVGQDALRLLNMSDDELKDEAESQDFD